MQRIRGKHRFDYLEAKVLVGHGIANPGNTYYVNTITGNDNYDGKSWAGAFKTMAAALALAGDNDFIVVIGDVREQLVAPLGVTGVKVIGAAGGNNRHDAGVRWRQAAVAGDKPLITIREQGWEFHNILFVPQDGHASIRAHRAEDATYPDSSHFIVRRCKFIGPVALGAAGAGYGIEDYGGNHHYIVEDCEFNELAKAIACTNHGIAAPLRGIIRGNIFDGNTSDIEMNGSHMLIEKNLFRTKYAVGHPTTVNLALTADPATGNTVIDNTFADAAADVTIAKGYKPSTGDVWRNRVTDAADSVVAVPT
jgi:hypothetical protein